jgi:tRNA-Thr(GGU) m(6)t(6)A37 methyltransferase TsaA
MDIALKPIGVVRSPFSTPEGMPIQASASEAVGSIEVFEEYVEGLRDIEGFDHIIVLYRFHLSQSERLRVTPFLDSLERGVFATRAPSRPNRVGLSVVKLLSLSGRMLSIGNVDMVDGTPVIDIKPYVPAFDHRNAQRIGWFAGRLDQVSTTKSDDRMR